METTMRFQKIAYPYFLFLLKISFLCMIEIVKYTGRKVKWNFGKPSIPVKK